MQHLLVTRGLASIRFLSSIGLEDNNYKNIPDKRAEIMTSRMSHLLSISWLECRSCWQIGDLASISCHSSIGPDNTTKIVMTIESYSHDVTVSG